MPTWIAKAHNRLTANVSQAIDAPSVQASALPASTGITAMLRVRILIAVHHHDIHRGLSSTGESKSFFIVMRTDNGPDAVYAIPYWSCRLPLDGGR